MTAARVTMAIQAALHPPTAATRHQNCDLRRETAGCILRVVALENVCFLTETLKMFYVDKSPPGS